MKQEVPEEREPLLAVQAEEDVLPEVLAEAAGEDTARPVPPHACATHQLTRHLHLQNMASLMQPDTGYRVRVILRFRIRIILRIRIHIILRIRIRIILRFRIRFILRFRICFILRITLVFASF